MSSTIDTIPRVLPSVCALDCPDACSLRITVEGDRVTGLTGAPDHPITRGFACAKMVRYPERQEQADRLLWPMRRVGPKGAGQFERIDWNTALDEIGARTQQVVSQYGPQSVLPYCYGGTMGVIESQAPMGFFRALGALELDQTICATTGGAGWEANYGPNKLGTDPEELVHAKFIILWGINAMRSNSHVAPILKEARQRGAKIVHIDPFRNETSRFVDEHLQIKVGTDAALALAIGGAILKRGYHDAEYLASYAHGLDAYRMATEAWTIPRAAAYCDLSIASIESLVEQLGTAPPSYIKIGYGMTRNEGGGNAMRAISLLPALTGAWKLQGGGAAISTSGAFGLNTFRLSGKHLLRPGARHVNMNLLATELEQSDPGIRAMFVFNSNPVAVAPDSSRVRAGMCNPDLLTVVLDHFQTDTADYADYLLPATTFLEHADVYTSYGHYYLQYAAPVVAARGDAKPNSWFFSQLAHRMGIRDESLDWSTEDRIRSLLDASNPWLSGITAESLMRERSIKLKFPKPFLPYADGSNFADRKIRFDPPPTQIEFEEQPNPTYPLRLISPPGPVILNTSMGNVPSILKMAGGVPQVIVHPLDAATYGIDDGDMVSISSAQGSIVRKGVVSPDAKQGVVVALGQWWPKLSPDRKSLNDLTSERLTDLGGGSTFGNPVVAIRKAKVGPIGR